MSKKKTLNLNLDAEIVEFYQDNYPGMVSKIVNSLSKEFKDAIERKPATLQKIIHNEMGLYEKKIIEDLKDKI